MVSNILISIFIPIYNGEKYLKETLLSIKNQSYQNIEVLLVDDSSTDNSLSIIKFFCDNDSRFKFFSKQNGGMVAKSWNFILPEIKGDCVFYSSQDDLFSQDLIQKMVTKIIDTHADIILPDMEYYYEKLNNNIQIIGLNSNRDIILNGKQAFLESLNWNIHGFALIKKNLFDNEVFPEDAFDSDEFVTRKIFYKSKTVAFSEGTFFYRQDNINAITKKVDVTIFYTLNTLLKLYFFIKENNFHKHLILQYQYKLQRQFLEYYALFKIFKFENSNSRLLLKNYLKDFKIQNLENFPIANNFVGLQLSFFLKYLVVSVIFKSHFLFKLFVKKEIFRLKKNSKH